jgi:hypothetical protein
MLRRAQHDFITERVHAFSPIEADAADTTMACFRYMGGTDFESLPPLPPDEPQSPVHRLKRAARRLRRAVRRQLEWL